MNMKPPKFSITIHTNPLLQMLQNMTDLAKTDFEEDDLDKYLTDQYGLRNTFISMLIGHNGLDKNTFIIDDHGYNSLLLKKIKELLAMCEKYTMMCNPSFYHINYPEPSPKKKEVA